MARNECLVFVETDLRATAFPRPRDYVVSYKPICSRPKQIPKLPKNILTAFHTSNLLQFPGKKAKKHIRHLQSKAKLYNWDRRLCYLKDQWLNWIHKDSFVGEIASHEFESTKIIQEKFQIYPHLSLVQVLCCYWIWIPQYRKKIRAHFCSP